MNEQDCQMMYKCSRPSYKYKQEYVICYVVAVLTNAAVKAGVRFKDVSSGEVNGIAGEAHVAADRRLRLQPCDGVSVGGGTGSCTAEHTIRYETSPLHQIPSLLSNQHN